MKASISPAPAQLWRVVSSFHMGDFVRGILEKRHINVASVAEEMGISRTTFGGYLEQKMIGDVVLIKITAAIGFDLYSMVKAEVARLTGSVKAGSNSIASDPPVAYGRQANPGPEGQGMVWQLYMDDFDDATQAEILRFVQQLRRKPGALRRTAS